MGSLRFRRSFKIAPGVKFNLNKNSTSITFGKRGMHYTVNSKGTTTKTIGIPGTGLYYTDTQKINKSNKINTNNSTSSYTINNVPNNNTKKNTNKEFILKRIWFIILMLFLVPPFGLFLMWYYKEWHLAIKLSVTFFFTIYFIGYLS